MLSGDEIMEVIESTFLHRKIRKLGPVCACQTPVYARAQRLTSALILYFCFVLFFSVCLRSEKTSAGLFQHCVLVILFNLSHPVVCKQIHM